MKREQRLRRAADFTAVHRRGRGVSGPALALRSLHTGASLSRVGFAVGKRVGGAVVRNRIKRRLRAIVASLPLAPGRDLVISARPAAAARDYRALRAELCALLQRARLLLDESEVETAPAAQSPPIAQSGERRPAGEGPQP
ncbi:MAG TPA: ribonuclease P protein component [Dehalococcoidia bacterium]|nr:ribonuclease P protein component [Dehalococcoidia bacterium]